MRVIALLCALLLIALACNAQSDCPSGTMSAVFSDIIDGSIPDELPGSTYEAWLKAINSATRTIDIACYYMTLTEGATAPAGQGGRLGMTIYKALMNAAQYRGVKIRIVQQTPAPRMPAYDTGNLTAMNLAEVRSIDFAKVNGFSYLPGSRGILHTKFLVADDQFAYVGSANMDWRSLSQVKETGVFVSGCETFAKDLGKVFTQYWDAAAATSLPIWDPNVVGTTFTASNPMVIGGDNTRTYIASGPATFAAYGRVDELDAIMLAINSSKSFLKFAVMDYIPTSMYVSPAFYWPNIDDALRSAALSGVKISLMFSIWNSTNPKELPYWRSLASIPNIEVKTYKVPPSPYNPQAPFSRVSHSKFIVTDQSAYVTTSNCGADYYLYTGGVSVTILGTSSPTYATLIEHFDQDFSSPFAGPIPTSLPPKGRP